MPKRERSAALEAAELLDRISSMRMVSKRMMMPDLPTSLRAMDREFVRMENALICISAWDATDYLAAEVKRIERRRAAK